MVGVQLESQGGHMLSNTSPIATATNSHQGLALVVAAGVVAGRITSFFAGLASEYSMFGVAVQLGLTGLALVALVLGLKERRTADTAGDLFRARLATRIGGVQLAIGALLLVAGHRVPQILAAGADWLG